MEFREYEKQFLAVRERIEAEVYHPVGSLQMEAYKSKEPLAFSDRLKGDYFVPKLGETWGELFACAWFHFTGTVPKEAAGKKVVLLIDFSGEGLVYTKDGDILQGLTSATSRDEFPLGLWGKKTIEIAERAIGGEVIDLWVDAGCNDIEGQYKNDGRVKEAAIAVVDTECRALFYDWVVCQSLYIGLCENKDSYGEEIRPIIGQAAEILSVITPQTVKQARTLLGEILHKKNEEVQLTYSSLGHSHLDLLFLWPLRETIRKGARTFSTVLKMMDLFPEYLFGCSQVPLYQWMKQYYPSLYEKILIKIKERRWEVLGSFFIECDTNLPSGESLVRQLLYGKKFFKQEFGFDMKVGFLPDVFGYSAALPQLLKKSGTPYFMTQKLSYNDTNRFPRHTFWWEGIDGSKVLTHMLPEDSYTSAAVPQMGLYGLHHYKDLDRCKDAMQLFGLGDGGGGAGYEHFERKRRMKNLKGCPPHRDEFVSDFFRRIEENQESYRSWKGEFYLERHQGTYTSIAKSKKYNREAEQALHTLEWLSVLAEVKCGLTYPKERIQEIWEEILLYQFHDCLPGSSIQRVYTESHERYEKLLAEIKERTELAVKAVKELFSLEAQELLCINPAPVSVETSITAEQKVKQVSMKPYSICLLLMADAKEENEELLQAEGSYILENTYVRAEFTNKGTISRLIHKETGFSMLAEQEEGNKLLLYPDELTHWDIEKDYLKKVPVQAETSKIQILRKNNETILLIDYTVGQSTIKQRVSLQDTSGRLDFNTWVDWQEEYQMLRVAFPTSVVTDHVTCAIQFGHVKRPTHTNTSWDEAKFEICAQQWADISDSGSGLAMLSDCKYGYNVWNNVFELCLLRSQNCPCEHGDRGIHTFTYAIYPHTGDVLSGGVIAEGYRLNYPVMLESTSKGKHSSKENLKELQFFQCDKENIIVETVKKAEEGDFYIARLYEAAGRRTKGKISFEDFTIKAVCNLLEQPEQPVENGTELLFQPFEVHTLLLSKKESCPL